MEEEDATQSAPAGLLVLAMALVGILSTLVPAGGVLVDAAVAPSLNPVMSSSLGSQFDFLRIIFFSGAYEALYPWLVGVLCVYALPFLLFFLVGGWARIDPYDDLRSVSIQGFGWGVVVSLVWPALQSSAGSDLEGSPAPNLAQLLVSRLSDPFVVFGIIGGAVIFATIAVSGVTIRYFWDRQHFHPLREWLRKENEPGDDGDAERGSVAGAGETTR